MIFFLKHLKIYCLSVLGKLGPTLLPMAVFLIWISLLKMHNETHFLYTHDLILLHHNIQHSSQLDCLQANLIAAKYVIR